MKFYKMLCNSKVTVGEWTNGRIYRSKTDVEGDLYLEDDEGYFIAVNEDEKDYIAEVITAADTIGVISFLIESGHPDIIDAIESIRKGLISGAELRDVFLKHYTEYTKEDNA